jgi:thiol:disulfide interchange protein DsbD
MELIKTFIRGMAIVLLFPFLLSAQIPDPVKFRFTEVPDSARAGEVFEVELTADIEPNWHLYSINVAEDAGPFPTRISAGSANVLIGGEITESDPEIIFDPNFEAEVGWHSNQAIFQIPVALHPDLQGETYFELELFYQVCDDKICLAPKKKLVEASIILAGVSDNPVSGFGEAVPKDEDSSEATLGSEGFFAFFWLALTAGFAALLTPCVFPMIPLTVSYFSKQSEREGGGNPVGRALLFGLAIVITFTALGAILAAVLGVSGANNFASNPWVNLSIGLVLVFFAFSLLGMYELQLPHQLTNWLNKQSNERGGILGILFMSLTISAVSFSCTAPFVGAVLAATTGGEWFYPVIGMIGFSAAFASPFVLFALFPRWLESLPKSGSWMNVVKVLLGFVELAAAFKFISNADLVWGWNLVSRPFTIAAWIAIFLLAGLYVLGVYALKHEKKPDHIGPGRLLLSIPLLLFSFYLIPGLLGASLGIWDAWLPPKQASDVSVVASFSGRVAGGEIAEAEGWSDDYEASLEIAKAENKPIFIDFTGYTCTNCRAMEANVFPLESVQQRFDRMELVRLFTDDGVDGEKNQLFQFELTGTVALPTYSIVDPESGEVLAQLIGFSNEKEFVDFLDTGISRFNRK